MPYISCTSLTLSLSTKPRCVNSTLGSMVSPLQSAPSVSTLVSPLDGTCTGTRMEKDVVCASRNPRVSSTSPSRTTTSLSCPTHAFTRPQHPSWRHLARHTATKLLVQATMDLENLRRLCRESLRLRPRLRSPWAAGRSRCWRAHLRGRCSARRSTRSPNSSRLNSVQPAPTSFPARERGGVHCGVASPGAGAGRAATAEQAAP
eukprot:3939684-Rhodomonas_salina.4